MSANLQLPRVKTVYPVGVPLGNRQLRIEDRYGSRRSTCCACGVPRSAPNNFVLCERCDDAIQSWARIWNALGMEPRCPPDELEYRIQLYQQRAAAGLDLFEPSSEGSFRD